MDAEAQRRAKYRRFRVVYGAVFALGFFLMVAQRAGLLSLPGVTAGDFEPRVKYDWSTFTVNERLSRDFTEAVRESLDPAHTESNLSWLGMKREAFGELGYLGFREIRFQHLRGFKNSTNLGFTITRKDGTVVRGWTKGAEHLLFPMVVTFQDDGSLVVKTHGEEKNLDYRTQRDHLTHEFTWCLYSATTDQLRDTPRFQQLQAAKERAAAAATEAQRQQNRKTWE